MQSTNLFLEDINMTETSYLYQYFLEKSPEDKKAKKMLRPSETEKKNVKGMKREDKKHE